MPRIISVHEYELRPEADPADFEAAVQEARDENLLDLPGLEDYYLLKGIKGARARRYGAIWIYESRTAWTALWGPPDDPVEKPDYPENWKTWEDEVLAPYLRDDPDAIRFTSYQELPA
ncbi:MAG: hypothetical protein ABEL51_14890 [Salinibacter sp.]